MTMSRMEVRGDLLRVEALDGDYLKLSIVTTAYVFTYTIRRDELESRIRGTERTVVYVHHLTGQNTINRGDNVANTPSIEALEDGNFKVSIHSDGERDMSAKVSPDELDAMVQRAHNDVARGVFGKHPAEKPAEVKEEPKADPPKKRYG